MLEVLIVLGIFVLIDAYIIWRIRYIKQSGSKIEGRIVKVKSKGDAFASTVYVSTVEYTCSDGTKGITKAQTFGRKGQTVELYEYQRKDKLKAVYIINYLNGLGFTLTISVILLALILIEYSN